MPLLTIIQGHGVAVLVGNKSDSSGKYYSSPVPPSCTVVNNMPCTFIGLIHLSLSNWAIWHTVINNKLADRYFHVGYLSWVIYLCNNIVITMGGQLR